MFSSYGDMGPNHQCLRINRSFAARYMCGEITSEVLRSARVSTYGKPSTGIGATGGAWAFSVIRSARWAACWIRASSAQAIGTWLSAWSASLTCILKRTSLRSAAGRTPIASRSGRTARQPLFGRTSASSTATRSTTSMEQTKRGYPDRWKILRDQDFDPQRDLHRDWQGLYQLAPHRIGLRDGIRGYFRSRNEDGNEI
jgi:hypothetical protein